MLLRAIPAVNCGFVGNAVLSPCPVEGPNEAQGRSPSRHGAAFTKALRRRRCLDVCNSTRFAINIHLNVAPQCIIRKSTQRLFPQSIINRYLYVFLVSEMYVVFREAAAEFRSILDEFLPQRVLSGETERFWHGDYYWMRLHASLVQWYQSSNCTSSRLEDSNVLSCVLTKKLQNVINQARLVFRHVTTRELLNGFSPNLVWKDFFLKVKVV